MNYPTIVDGIDFRQLVTAADGEPITDSFQIAKAFGKRHADVLRALKNCHCSEDFRRAHFCVAEKINELGIFDKKQIYYRMDFSGFVMLVMGFNGAKADAVKEAYINAFNWMSAELRKFSESYEAERNAVMLEYMKEKYSAAIFLIPICISFDTDEKRRYATYLILNRRFSFEF